jgi:GTP-binding protein Era
MNGDKSGTVALVGRANAGKSTLMNRLLGEKVSIVSPVAQTTRNLIRGVLTDRRGQLVLLDSPGIHKSPGDLGRMLNRLARLSVEGADVVLLVLDGAQPPRDEDEGWMLKLARRDGPWFVALNKSDLEARHADAYRELWTRTAAAAGGREPSGWLSVSGETGAGRDALLDTLFAALPEGAPAFSDEILTDFPRNLAIADLIREKFFARLEDELPHAMAVFVDKLTESDEGWLIDATVYVEKPSQKGIVIGNKGRLIRAVTRASEKEIRTVFEHRAKIILWVKVEPHWARNIWILQQLGYV